MWRWTVTMLAYLESETFWWNCFLKGHLCSTPSPIREPSHWLRGSWEKFSLVFPVQWVPPQNISLTHWSHTHELPRNGGLLIIHNFDFLFCSVFFFILLWTMLKGFKALWNTSCTKLTHLEYWCEERFGHSPLDLTPGHMTGAFFPQLPSLSSKLIWISL